MILVILLLLDLYDCPFKYFLELNLAESFFAEVGRKGYLKDYYLMSGW